jgi:hypothetical protein
MTGRIGLWMTGCFIMSVGTVVVLVAMSDSLKNRPGSFVRVFPAHVTNNERVLDIKYNSYYVAGHEKHHVYLGNPTAPLHLLKVAMTLADVEPIELRITDFDRYRFRSVLVTLDSPYFFISDGTLPGVFRGLVGDWEAHRFTYDSTYFTQFAVVGRQSFALSVVRFGESVLGKWQAVDPQFIYKGELLQKQGEGIFSTDGLLRYNGELNRLIYVYYYRNQYVCTDSSLNLLYNGRTIDTISHAKIKVDTIRSSNAVTMATPALTVNKHAAVYGQWLFIHSLLMAKNEDEKRFNESSVIDVYNLMAGTYQFSFYLEDFQGAKLKDLEVTDGRVIALFDHYLVLRELNTTYFVDTIQ